MELQIKLELMIIHETNLLNKITIFCDIYIYIYIKKH